ncbi:hypothetical protein ACIHFE_28790 [Streptomyces sp. NPDC052396]|uniref:hypothetical protein n=1 Tax=Streptomyces sp. NPDC052396 TaxID=3365689 RepID=UPI0037CD81B9
MTPAPTAAPSVKSVEMVTVPPDAAGVPGGGLLPPAGSVVLYVGDAAAPSWQRLREAALRGDWQAVRDTPIPQRPAPGVRLVAASRLFDLLCAAHPLVRDLALPQGFPFRTLAFPYTGGPLQGSDFSIVEHTERSVPSVTAAYLLVRRAPELTALERRLLENVSPVDRHIHMGRPEPCQTLTTLDMITDNLACEAHRAVQCKHRGGCLQGESTTELSDAEIEEITGGADGFAASVARLLATRQRHYSL